MAEKKTTRTPAPRKTGGSARRARATKPARAECSIALCPICTALTSVQEVRPEVVGHLMAASRELLLALRSFIDSRVEAAGSQPLQKIDIA